MASSAPPGRGGDPLAVLLGLDALDLPDVGLDARGLQLLDRAPHQLRAQLRVVAVRVAADLLQLGALGRHQQLEEELPLALVEPVAEATKALALAAVHLGVPVGDVAHEDLREVGVEPLDVIAELVAVVEVELVLARLLDRHRQHEAALLGLLGDALRRAELLVDEAACAAWLGAPLGGLQHALEDQVLGVGDRLRLLWRGVALDPEHLLLERASMVEGQDVELAVVAECHSGAAASFSQVVCRGIYTRGGS